MNFKYFMESVLTWMLNNKTIVFLSLLSFCLFVSVLALAGQKNRLVAKLDQCEKEKNDMATPKPTDTTGDETSTTTDSSTTDGGTAPGNTTPETNPPASGGEEKPEEVGGGLRLADAA
ncbi:hypothetical protein JYU34_016031 [Plutella xylostella]|uniref:Uncharacterized protein n=1 Tax=Plutella xylostella TaxID=51655 RepID=A0ABQ7Q5E2_PLUXY|nr:hypothetical protein JYU34_016031 [Plutella xylostella]